MPYRAPHLRVEEPAFASEYVYAPVHRRALGTTAPGCFVAIPIVIGAIAAGASGSALVGLGTAIATGIVVWVLHQQNKTRGRVLLRVDGRTLFLSWPGTERHARLELDALEDVILDTKTIEPMQEGSSMIPALRVVNSTVGPPVDRARIAFLSDAGSLVLTDEHLSYTETTEQIAKLRVFLRKNGWVPFDEREDEADLAPKKKRRKKKK